VHAKVDMHIAQLGIELPTPSPPAGAYVPFVVAGGLLLVAGQLPMWNGTLKYDGRVGAEITLEDGIAAARLCGLNLLAQARAACDGDLDRVRRVLRLGGFVQAAPGFTDHPKVLNGASELMVEVFGQAGRHVRVAVGAASLPMAAAVEVEAMFDIA
jgi:enamine deaminase RidA (YjgF/YER057c/UK114 family)